MNFWALVVIIIVLSLLLFSKNPIREFQEAQKAMMEKYGTDELSIETNIYLEQQQKESQGYSGFFSGGKNQDAGQDVDMAESIRNSAGRSANNNKPSFGGIGSVFSGANRSGSSAPARDFESGDKSNVVISNYNTGASIGGNRGGGYSPNGTGSNSGANDDGYYPPIVGQGEFANGSQYNFTGREPKLRGGQPLSFVGSEVYMLDKNGNRIPLPDGTYTMEDGGRIRIVAGKNIAD